MTLEARQMVEQIVIYVMLLGIAVQIFCTFGPGDRWTRFLLALGLQILIYATFFRVILQLLK